jgi:hypothetical protein
MTSKTELCNLALLKLGKARVQDIDTDPSQQATDLKLAYDFTLNQILDEAQWSFAVRRQALNKLTETPLYQWNYKFALPTNPEYIKLISIENDPLYSIEGKYILTNEDNIKITYIARITDPSEYTTGFKNAFVLLLASKICYNLTGSDSREKQLLSEYQDALYQAITQFKAISNEVGLTSNEWIETRQNG